MAETWTTPKTWAQEIVTVGDLNAQLRDNLLYLRNRPLYTDNATGLSSTATSDTDLRTLWFAVQHERPVLLLATAAVNTSSGSHVGTFKVKVDGTPYLTMPYASTSPTPLTFAAIVTGLTAGTHSLRLSGYVTTGTLYCNYVRLSSLELA